MSSVWSWFIIIGTVVTLVASFWLIVWTNRQRASDEEIAEAEGHVWDENVRELNNPLPMWWLWLFIITIIWGAGYLVWYPGMGGFAGVSGWSQEGQYQDEVAAAEAQYGPMFASYGSMSVEELVNDEGALAIGFSLYQNYCSQCHGSTAQGARGFPNLTDDVWQWGDTPQAIEHAILYGRSGVMPPLNAVFGSEEAIDEMVRYTQNMADGMDTSSPAHTQYMQLCVACHGPTGEGMTALGAPSLVDDNWLYGSSPTEIRKSIVEGRNGVMPAHADLIGTDRARILAAYVYSLSQ
jgi:cytochrome c oxidase cbb3-type subunit 3